MPLTAGAVHLPATHPSPSQKRTFCSELLKQIKGDSSLCLPDKILKMYATKNT